MTWKRAQGYNGILHDYYLISSNGKGLYCLEKYDSRGRYRFPFYPSRKNTDRDGYIRYRVYIDGKYHNIREHIVVARTFLGEPPKGKEVRHLDGNKKNNKKHNLRYGTDKQNMRDQDKHGTRIKGERVHFAKITKKDVINIRRSKRSTKILAIIYDLSEVQINNIISKRSWKHV